MLDRLRWLTAAETAAAVDKEFSQSCMPLRLRDATAAKRVAMVVVCSLGFMPRRLLALAVHQLQHVLQLQHLPAVVQLQQQHQLAVVQHQQQQITVMQYLQPHLTVVVAHR